MQKFLYVIGAFVAILIVIGLLLPRHTRVEVSALVDAPPATVFALVNDFRRVDLWSPKTASDPNARVIFSGPPRGIGATVTWDGVIVGSGTQAIVESRPYEHIATMINPGEAGEARTWFDFAREDGKTRVTWGFAHDHGLNLVGRYFALLLSGVVKREFENGIAALQELAASFDSEIAPVLVEVEGRTLKLEGSAETQFAEWRRLLREIFAAETGFPLDPDTGQVTQEPATSG